jgi:transposase
VQQYAVGRLYVPPRRSKRTSSTKRIEKLFDEGLSVAEIALRMKLSKRQVYRLKKDWSSNSWRREMDNAPGQSQHLNSAFDEPFKSRSTLKKCPGCDRHVVERGATYCDLCKYIKGDDVDGNVIVLTDLPFPSAF